MKAFAIRDASIQKERDLAWLLYDPDSMCFTIEICEDVDEWEAPLILSSFVKLEPGLGGTADRSAGQAESRDHSAGQRAGEIRSLPSPDPL